MKILLTILLSFTLLTMQGQTMKVAASTSTSATTIYTKTGVDAIVTKQAAVDKLQDANFAALPVMDTVTFKVVTGKVTIPAIPLLQSQDKITSSAIAVLQEQNTSLQKQVNDLTAQIKFNAESAAMQITALQAQVLELTLQVSRIMVALQKPIL